MSGEAPWFVSAFGGKMSEEYQRYMAEEWGYEKRGDQPLFEKLCLEGAQAGLSWATILAKRDNYRNVFHGFDIERCAAMTDAELSAILEGASGVVRHRGKIASVRHNAQCVLDLIAEHADEPPPPHGWFDDFLWSFVDGTPVLNEWPGLAGMPSETEASRHMAAELKRRGFKFVGPTICYSLMQSCGLVIDHPKDTPEWRAAKLRLTERAQQPDTSEAPKRKKRRRGS